MLILVQATLALKHLNVYGIILKIQTFGMIQVVLLRQLIIMIIIPTTITITIITILTIVLIMIILTKRFFSTIITTITTLVVTILTVMTIRTVVFTKISFKIILIKHYNCDNGIYNNKYNIFYFQ